MPNTQKILAAYDALYAQRKPFWILAIPTDGDIKGLVRDTAARTGLERDDIAEAIATHRPHLQRAGAIA